MPQGWARFIILYFNLVAAVFCRVAWVVFVEDDLPEEPEWMEDPTTLVFTKYSRRRGLVFFLRFCAASLFFFAATVVAGFEWVFVDNVVWVWGPADLQGAAWVGPGANGWVLRAEEGEE